MRIVWASLLIFGFLSLADGYFKVPGMEKLDTPYDHLFRGGGPPKMNDWDMPPSNGFKVKTIDATPQMHYFYHKMEDPSYMQEPMGQLYYSHSPVSRYSLPKVGYSNDLLSPITRISGSIKVPARQSSLMNEPGEQSERTSDGEERVVGGRDVSEGEIPWQVSLQRKSMKSGRIFHICGGSILNSEWVVTAAHCVALALLSNYRVVSATTNLRDENRIKGLSSYDYSIHKVVDVHIHDEYDMFRFRNDIALIRVEPPFQFSHKVQAISLPSSGETAHGMAYASGWGLTQEGVRVTPSKLQAVALPIVPDHECRQAYGDNLAETMICAGYKEGGKSVCQGDSGGPLYQKHGGSAVLIGVVSWGVGCARPGKPGVYTEVSHYIGWIHDITGGVGRQNLIH